MQSWLMSTEVNMSTEANFRNKNANVSDSEQFKYKQICSHKLKNILHILNYAQYLRMLAQDQLVACIAWAHTGARGNNAVPYASAVTVTRINGISTPVCTISTARPGLNIHQPSVLTNLTRFAAGTPWSKPRQPKEKLFPKTNYQGAAGEQCPSWSVSSPQA